MDTDNNIIALIYRRAFGSVDDETFLREIAEYLAAKSGWIWTHDFRDGSCKVHASWGINDSYIKSYVEQYARLNPWLEDRDAYARPGAVLTGRDFLNKQDLAKTAFYTEWLQPQGLSRRIACVLSVDGDQVTAFEFLREKTAPCFGRREVVMCGALLAHWLAASEMNVAMSDMVSERDAAWDLLERLPFGVALVNPACELVVSNQCFSELLENGNGLTSRRRKLRARSHSDCDALQALVTKATERPANGHAWQGVMMLSRAADQRPLQVMVSSLPRHKGGSIEPSALAAVFIHNPDEGTAPNQNTLRQLYGLTNAEAQIASLVSQGLRLDEITETMGVALNTGRTHLKRIFSKTGTQRQAELVQLLLRGPSILVEHREHSSAVDPRDR